MSEDIVVRLHKRAEIRRNAATRKSVQEGKPDRLADLLEEAAATIVRLRSYNLNILSRLSTLELEAEEMGDYLR